MVVAEQTGAALAATAEAVAVSTLVAAGSIAVGVDASVGAVKSAAVGTLQGFGLKDAHHIIQDAAVRDLPGYSTLDAPGVQLPGPPNKVGTPHHATRAVQRQMGGGTYAAERRIAYKALRAAGINADVARRLIEQADRYFTGIGVTPATRTRTPGDRR